MIVDGEEMRKRGVVSELLFLIDLAHPSHSYTVIWMEEGVLDLPTDVGTEVTRSFQNESVFTLKTSRVIV